MYDRIVAPLRTWRDWVVTDDLPGERYKVLLARQGGVHVGRRRLRKGWVMVRGGGLEVPDVIRSGKYEKVIIPREHSIRVPDTWGIAELSDVVSLAVATASGIAQTAVERIEDIPTLAGEVGRWLGVVGRASEAQARLGGRLPVEMYRGLSEETVRNLKREYAAALSLGLSVLDMAREYYGKNEEAIFRPAGVSALERLRRLVSGIVTICYRWACLLAYERAAFGGEKDVSDLVKGVIFNVPADREANTGV